MQKDGKWMFDLHMHTLVSDGTDDPKDMPALIKKAGITLFSITDHDALEGCRMVLDARKEDDPSFITGVEFSCRDKLGKYHILGYGYDLDSEPINKVISLGHSYRMSKLEARLGFLESEFGFAFPEEAINRLYSQKNPGKPHIGNMMVEFGYAKTKEEAIKEYINKMKGANQYVRPEEAIEGILGSGGIPVLAHPSYGSGDELILGDEMDQRLKRLMDFGLAGVEAFYSGFTTKLQNAVLRFAEKYALYVTAGSDYHGLNKMVVLGNTNFEKEEEMPPGMVRFLEHVHVNGDGPF